MGIFYEKLDYSIQFMFERLDYLSSYADKLMDTVIYSDFEQLKFYPIAKRSSGMCQEVLQHLRYHSFF